MVIVIGWTTMIPAVVVILTSCDPSVPIGLGVRIAAMICACTMLAWPLLLPASRRWIWVGAGMVTTWSMLVWQSPLHVLSLLAFSLAVIARRGRRHEAATIALLVALGYFLSRFFSTYPALLDLVQGIDSAGRVDFLSWGGPAWIGLILAAATVNKLRRPVAAGALLLVFVAGLIALREGLGCHRSASAMWASHLGPLSVRMLAWVAVWSTVLRSNGLMQFRVGAAAILALFAACVLVNRPASGQREQLIGKRIAVIDSSGANLRRPDLSLMGDDDTAMFGALVDLLAQTSGDRPEILHPSEVGARCREFDVLVAINAGAMHLRRAAADILAFTNDGGTLVVCVDHTNVFGAAECWNEVLASTGIKMRYDSAVPLGVNFYGAFDWVDEAWGAIEGSIGPGIGCSLQVTCDWRALATGRTILRDCWLEGNVFGGHLGGYVWDPTERVGSCVVSASRTFGRGQIVVHGDTGVWQNGPIRSDGGFAVRRLFGALDCYLDNWLAGLGGLALLVWIASRLRRSLAEITFAGLALGSLAGAGLPAAACHRDVVFLNEGLDLSGHQGTETSEAGDFFQGLGFTVGRSRFCNLPNAVAMLLSLRGRSDEGLLLRRALAEVTRGASLLVLVSEEGFLAHHAELAEIGVRSAKRLRPGRLSAIHDWLDPHCLVVDETWENTRNCGKDVFVAERLTGGGKITMIGNSLFFAKSEWSRAADTYDDRLRILRRALVR